MNFSKKTIGGLICVILVVIMVASSLASCTGAIIPSEPVNDVFAEETESETTVVVKVLSEGEENGFKYVEYDNGDVVVTEYTGTADKITVPASLKGKAITKIGSDIFKRSKAIKEITVSEGIKAIGFRAFGDCTALNKVVLPTSVTSIDNFAFQNCSSLTDVNIPSSVTKMGSGIFYGCAKIENVTLPESISKITDFMFYGCEKLTGVNIPDGVTVIGNHAFADCKALKDVTIPVGVKMIQGFAFRDTAYLADLKKLEDDFVIVGDGVLLAYNGKETKVTVDDGVKFISSAFAKNTTVTEITLPEGVEAIGNNAFASCTALKSIHLPESVTKIGIGAFSSCTAFADMYYSGSSDKWKEVKIGSDNSAFTSIKDDNKHFGVK